MKLTPEEMDELLGEGFVDPPKNFETTVMARIEEQAWVAATPLYVIVLRFLALFAGVGVGVTQALRFFLGFYFIGALN